MIGRSTRRLYKDGNGARLGLPKIWVEAWDLRPGAEVDAHFDRVLVLIPRQFEMSEQAIRVLRALRETA
jgi:hypothetical protein